MEKKRVIVDHKNISNELIQKLMEKHPYGYEEAVIKFRNAKGEMVSAVPIETDDTKYLIKVSIALTKRVEDFLDEEEDSTEEIPEAANADEITEEEQEEEN